VLWRVPLRSPLRLPLPLLVWCTPMWVKNF
jgi:hypothetical protein